MLQPLDHRLRRHGSQSGQSFTGTGHDGNECEVFRDIDQMRLGGGAVPFTPLDHTFKRLIQELVDHHHHHDLTEYGHEH
ncbi:hypothetical protein D3C81_1890170 [compost metagenome]